MGVNGTVPPPRPIGEAIGHKVDGNEQFKKRRYREAVMAYTAGLRTMKSGDRELTAVLLSNRAAAHYHLGGYSVVHTGI